ncbi:TPA: hypothetical protein ACKP2Y_003084 [Pseudomonas putida]|uniref:hypothetical protein n=1 Tax=Pseudomonas TaxID=286 RepID=UPI0012DB62E5|nr:MULTISPECIES: hypothetical protein [Pseudomonas]MDN4514732.1 hypothetical protein [Pseudomonas sp. 2,4-D]
MGKLGKIHAEELYSFWVGEVYAPSGGMRKQKNSTVDGDGFWVCDRSKVWGWFEVDGCSNRSEADGACSASGLRVWFQGLVLIAGLTFDQFPAKIAVFRGGRQQKEMETKAGAKNAVNEKAHH